MALNFTVDDGILVIQGGGNWNFGEMKKTLKEAVRALGDRRAAGVLFDDRNSGFTGHHEDFNDMARFRKMLADRIGTKMAVVVSDDLHFGLARMSSAIHSFYGIDIEPFRDREEARQWLSEQHQ
ncbi:MAG: STAS/SEC14 domain-containing protein [Desulfobacterales bacterium]|jgi:hypothetical protein